ncbi:hypothetical protein G7054_g2653 [Neopestalotiopsis clavispora]|nr:hypothetical protein G7054_g2653 [Neopestalotiopsis clavispora]
MDAYQAHSQPQMGQQQQHQHPQHGQFQPYPLLYPQPYPQQYLASPPGVTPSSKGWHITKLVFYSLSIVFCVIVLGTSIALVVDPNLYQSYQIIWVAPQAGIALCWDIAELIAICVRRGHHGIHPGAHVALHLLLWLGFLVAAGLTGWLVAYASEYDSSYQRYYYNYYSRQYLPIMQAELAFLVLLVLVHFVLFVRACVETHQRNRLALSVMPQQMYYTQPISHYSMQQMPPMQPEFPTQLQQAHAVDRQQQMGSGPDQHNLTGTTHDSLPSPIQKHGLHPPPVHQ